MPPTALRALIRPAVQGEGFELELQRLDGLAPRGLPVWIQLGSLQLRDSRESSTVGEYGLVFPVTRAQFEATPDGAEVTLLSSAGGGGRSLGRLDKAALLIH